MKYYLKLFWEDELNGQSEIIKHCDKCECDLHQVPFTKKTLGQNFTRITTTAQRLYDLDKPNQYYKVVAYEEHKDGTIVMLQKWERKV